jgi:thymidine kinase
MQEFHQTGHIEVVCGPMFCGKSEELIRRLRRVEISGKPFILFKPSVDTRYDPEHVVSHDARKLKAVVVGADRISLEKLDGYINAHNPFLEVVAFDEANFFDDYIAELSLKWAREDRRVIAAGLDQTFRVEPFGPMGKLLALADYVDKLKAICMKCRAAPATRTQRLIDGRPARWSDPTIMVGGKESYEARCAKCHEVVRAIVTTEK